MIWLVSHLGSEACKYDADVFVASQSSYRLDEEM
jgi:hypothetical protein